MFTGLVEEIGTIDGVRSRGDMAELRVSAHIVLDGIRLGDSISIAGVCQTVTEFDAATFTVQAVSETLRRTTFGTLRHGSQVNLERALKVGDRLGGHFVQGHVEGVGTVSSATQTGGGRDFAFEVPSALARYIVEKGSIAIDGISLTVTYATGHTFGVSVIPHTLAATTLGGLRPGSRVNLETDMIAKYIENLMKPGSEVTMDSLKRLGY